MQFCATVGTECQVLAHFMSISYAAGHKQMSSLLYQYIMSVLYLVSIGDILM
jgi:hypothetical protein